MKETKQIQKIQDIDQFYGNITKVGNSYAVIIPMNVIEYAGLKVKDRLKIWCRREK